LDSRKSLGKALERLRVEAGYSLEELAARAGLRAGRVAGYEAGVSEPRWKTVERLLAALEVGPGELGRRLEEVAGAPLEESHPIAKAIRFHQEAADLLLRVLERWPAYVERKRSENEPDREGDR